MIFKTLWRRRTRSFLTVLGIAIGVAAVISLGAMAEGMMKNYGSIVGLSNDILVTQADASDALFSTIDETVGQRLESVPGVESVEPGMYTWIATEEMPFFLVFGYEPDSVAMSHYRIVEGKPVRGDGQIAIGREVADALKKRLDDKLRLYGEPYRIVGIYETGQGMEETGGVVTLADAQVISQRPNKVSLFQVGVDRNADVRQVVARIESSENDVTATVASEYDASESYDLIMQGYAWGIAAIAIVIGGLGMMNAMVMSVMERTREIGTLRALGWTRRRVTNMIMGEALLLSLVGAVLGTGIGIAMTEAAARVPSIGAFLAGAYTPAIFIQGWMTAILLGLVGGAYPARRAANLRPVEALRYEGGSGEVDAARFVMGSQSLRHLWRRRMRTIISITGIGIGVATLVALGGMTKGMMMEFNALAGSGGVGGITIMQSKVADPVLSTLDERMVSQIQAMPGVKSVSPMLIGFLTTPDMPFFIIGGIDPNSNAMAHYKLVEGRNVERPNEVLLGKGAAKNYKLMLGGLLNLYNNRYRVVGIFETGVAYEDGAAILALRESQRLLNRQRSVSYIFVDVNVPSDAENVRATLERRFTDAQVSLSSQFAQDTGAIEQMDAITIAIGLLALLVGGIVVANTMMMSIYERTREIGTLRAVGWGKGRILGQVVQESLLLCFVAGLFGLALGWAMMTAMARFPFLDMFLSAEWDLGIFVRSMLIALLVGLVAGIYPAWRASRLQPVEALRYE